MRYLLLVSFLAATTVSHASFEMLLMGDNSGGTPKVTRYDPINRVSLGSFGQGVIPSAVFDVAVDQANNKAFVLSSGIVNAFNYNTGEYLGGASTSFIARAMAYNNQSDTLTFGEGAGSGNSGGVALRSNLSSAGLAFSSSYVSTAPIQRPDSSNFFAHTMALTGLVPLQATVWNSSASPIATQTSGTNWNGSNGVRDAVFVGQNIYGLNYDNASTQTFLSVSSTTTSFMPLPTIVGFFGNNGQSSTSRSIVAGHSGLMWIKVGNELRSYSPVNGFGVANTLSVAVGESTGMAMVLAPEPGSMVVLAMGAALLLRRRKSQ